MNLGQRLQWESNGFVVVPEILGAEGHAALRATFIDLVATAADSAGAQPDGDPRRWISDMHDRTPLCLKLAAAERILSVVEAIASSAVLLAFTEAFEYPSGRAPYTGWHSDLGHLEGLDVSNHLPLIRVAYFIDHVDAAGGCLAYVPGSQRLPLAMIRNPPTFDTLDEMPNRVLVPAPANGALVFNPYGWHTVTPNTSGRPRRCIHLGYIPVWARWSPLVNKKAAQWAATPREKALLGDFDARPGDAPSLAR